MVIISNLSAAINDYINYFIVDTTFLYTMLLYCIGTSVVHFLNQPPNNTWLILCSKL